MTDLRPAEFDLDAKYKEEYGSFFFTGIHALVRVPIEQMLADKRAGLSTAAFISGYQGSPLGGFDKEIISPPQADGRPQHRPPAGPERGAGRHCRHGQPGGRHLPSAALRWGARHLVRQGSGPRPGRRRHPPRPVRRHQPARRGAGSGRRRPGQQVLHPPVGLGVHDRRSPHADPASRQRAGGPRPGPPRRAPVPHRRPVDRHQDRHLGGRRLGYGRDRRPTGSSPWCPSSSGRASPIVPGPTAAWAGPRPTRSRRRSTRPACRWPCGTGPTTTSTGSRSTRETPGSASWPRAGCTTRSCRAAQELGLTPRDLHEHGVRVLQMSMPFPFDKAIVRHFAQGLQEIMVVEEKRPFMENLLREALYGMRQPAADHRQARRGRPDPGQELRLARRRRPGGAAAPPPR